MIVVRYADDAVVGFEHRADAERVLREWKARLQKFQFRVVADPAQCYAFIRHKMWYNRAVVPSWPKRCAESRRQAVHFSLMSSPIFSSSKKQPVSLFYFLGAIFSFACEVT
jgi:hypothetical protein